MPLPGENLQAVIQNGDTASGVVNLAGFKLCGLRMPSAFTGSTVTIQSAKTPDGTFQTVYKNGAELTISVAASKKVALDPADFAGDQFIKVVGSAQAAERTIGIDAIPV